MNRNLVKHFLNVVLAFVYFCILVPWLFNIINPWIALSAACFGLLVILNKINNTKFFS